MKLCTDVTYLKRIQKIYESRDKPQTYFDSLKISLINKAAILKMSAKMAILDLLKIKVF